MSERYRVEFWPPPPRSGMQTGQMGPGVKVTDTVTGRSHACNIYRQMHRNRDAAIWHLQHEWPEDRGEPHIGRDIYGPEPDENWRD